MWDYVALLGVILLAAGACVGVGLAIMRGEVKVLKTENEIQKAATGQAGRATEVTGDVLQKVRDRDGLGHSGPLDRSDVERLFGGRGPEADPPGRSPA